MSSTKAQDIKKTLKKITTGISWVIFAFLIIIAIILIYYFVATKIYEKKGKGYEPLFSMYTIISPSMVPNINVYDVVVNSKVSSPEDIQVGDIITFNSTDFTVGKSISVTHRVVEVLVDPTGHYSYGTKGDNNAIKDPKPVPYENITGKILIKIPQLGRVQFFIAKGSGWLLVVVLPALYIIIKDILKILKVIGNDDRKKKNFLFMPIKRKQLYLPLHGYVNSEGKKEKFTVSSLNPFTFDRGEKPRDVEEEPDIVVKEEPVNNVSLEEIYKDLALIAEDKK
jgi:signal peptidase